LKVERVAVVLGNWWLFGEYHEEAEEGQDTYLPNTGCETEKRWENGEGKKKKRGNKWVSLTIIMARESTITESPSTSTGTNPMGLSLRNSEHG